MIDLESFAADCYRDIPLLEAMQLEFGDYDDLTLDMQAPLAPNINNKGTAFGGSIASICLFGGWAVSTLAFMDHGIDNTEIVVHRSRMTFERPARGVLAMRARIEKIEFDACLSAFRAASTERQRLGIDVELRHDDRRCARMRGEYVAWLV